MATRNVVLRRLAVLVLLLSQSGCYGNTAAQTAQLRREQDYTPSAWGYPDRNRTDKEYECCKDADVENKMKATPTADEDQSCNIGCTNSSQWCRSGALQRGCAGIGSDVDPPNEVTIAQWKARTPAPSPKFGPGYANWGFGYSDVEELVFQAHFSRVFQGFNCGRITTCEEGAHSRIEDPCRSQFCPPDFPYFKQRSGTTGNICREFKQDSGAYKCPRHCENSGNVQQMCRTKTFETNKVCGGWNRPAVSARRRSGTIEKTFGGLDPDHRYGVGLYIYAIDNFDDGEYVYVEIDGDECFRAYQTPKAGGMPLFAPAPNLGHACGKHKFGTVGIPEHDSADAKFAVGCTIPQGKTSFTFTAGAGTTNQQTTDESFAIDDFHLFKGPRWDGASSSAAPTQAPSTAPTEHPCDAGEHAHGCLASRNQKCVKHTAGNGQEKWRCRCIDQYACPGNIGCYCTRSIGSAACDNTKSCVPGLSCGGHIAATCSDCPQGNGRLWCNGVCAWVNSACVASQAPTATPTTSPSTAPTSSPTRAPTKKPTASPTAAPTSSPTQHPCDEGEHAHGCLAAKGQRCVKRSPTEWRCRCTPSSTFCPTETSQGSPCECIGQIGVDDACDTDRCVDITSAPSAAPTGTPTKTPTTAPSTAPTMDDTAQLEVAGLWHDNFGGLTLIDSEKWGAGTVHEFDNETNWAITQNAADAAYNPSKYNYIVWTEPAEDGSWWTCTVAFGIETIEAARTTENTSDDSDPANSGCGAFGWTKMSTRPTTKRPTAAPRSSSPTVLPTKTPTRTVTADPSCATGIVAGTACCAAQCGLCGGADCGSRPGGARACCGNPINGGDRLCDSVDPPCKLTPSPRPTASPSAAPTASPQSASPSASPTTAPTPSPTVSPTPAPTHHTCDAGEHAHGCTAAKLQRCLKTSETVWQCTCQEERAYCPPGSICECFGAVAVAPPCNTTACVRKTLGPSRAPASSAPSSSPSPSPSSAPTAAPTSNPTMAPTNSTAPDAGKDGDDKDVDVVDEAEADGVIETFMQRVSSGNVVYLGVTGGVGLCVLVACCLGLFCCRRNLKTHRKNRRLKKELRDAKTQRAFEGAIVMKKFAGPGSLHRKSPHTDKRTTPRPQLSLAEQGFADAMPATPHPSTPKPSFATDTRSSWDTPTHLQSAYGSRQQGGAIAVSSTNVPVTSRPAGPSLGGGSEQARAQGKTVQALMQFDYAAEAPDELSARQGETMKVLSLGAGGDWTVVENAEGNRGCVPTDFITLLKKRNSRRQDK